MYQFIHIETYARQASTKQKLSKKSGEKAKKPKQDVRGVIAEAIREPGDCPHVSDPQPPRFLVGDEGVMRGMQEDIERNLSAHHARVGGRKVRSDAHVLLAGVASFPRDLQRSEPDTYKKWERLTVGWLQKKYGADLKAVLMHDDEDHPHIHFYVYSAERVNAKELHDGYAAAAHLPAMSKEAGIAHADAMRDMQSSFYLDVGHDCGLLRDGPKRKRLDRDTYKALQREERERVALGKEVTQVHADLLNGAATEAKVAAELRREAERENARNAVERAELTAEQAELAKLRDQMQRDRAALDGEWTRAREAKANAERWEQKSEKDRAALDKQAIRLEQAKATCNKEAEELRKRQTATDMVMRKYKTRLAGLGAVEDVRALVRKPELVGMLDFIDKNPSVRELLEVVKAEPHLAAAYVQVAREQDALGLGPDVQPTGWASPTAQAAEDWLGQEPDFLQKRSTGLDMGM